jgi:hypothetical protein
MVTACYRVFAWALSFVLAIIAPVGTVLWSTAVEAAIVDPSTLNMGPGNCPSPGDVMGCGNSPNLVQGGNLLTIFQQSHGGQANLPSPQLLILGVPNNTTNLFSTDPINSVVYENPLGTNTPVTGSSAFATGGTYGLRNPVTSGTGFFGVFTTGTVYNFLTLQGGTGNSNTFSAWQSALLANNGIIASNFGIYVFTLSGATLGALGAVNAGFLTVPPLGTFAAAYDQSSGGNPVFDTSLRTRPS